MNKYIGNIPALFKASWSVYKVHWQFFALLLVIPVVLNYISSILMTTGEPVAILVAFIVMAAAIVLSLLMSIAVIKHAKHASDGSVSDQRLSVYGSYRSAMGMFWPFLLISILSGLVFMGSFALLFVPGLIVGVYIAFTAYALIVDEKKGLSALLESYSIVRKQWLKAFLNLLVLSAMGFIVYMAVGLISTLIASAFGVAPAHSSQGIQSLPIWFTLFSLVINFAAQAVVTPLSIIYSYKLYQELKSTRHQDVSVIAFKRWSIAFMIIGPVFFLLFFIGSAFLISLKMAETQMKLRAQLADPSFQAKLEQALQK